MEALKLLLPLVLILGFWLPNVIKALTLLAKQVPTRIYRVAGAYAIALLFATAGYNAYNQIEEAKERVSVTTVADNDVDPEDDADPSRSFLDFMFGEELAMETSQSNNGGSHNITGMRISSPVAHIAIDIWSDVVPLEDTGTHGNSRDGPIVNTINHRDGYFNTS